MREGIADAVPTVFHIGHAAGERLFALSRSPVVAGGDPFVDELFCPCLEEVDASVGQGEDHAVWPLSVVPRWRQSMGKRMRQRDRAYEVRVFL